MKALLSSVAGGPETLRIETIADPLPNPGEVRIRVAACGINYPDVLIIQDLYQYKPERPFAPGGEIAGTIDLVGEGVDDLKVGDRVLANSGWGGLAEAVNMKANRCFRIPPAMPVDQAAAFLMTYGTSHYALSDRAGLRAGETLLVLGAAGGVGMAAVEIGKAMGAHVIGAVSTEAKAAVVREHGADEVIVYPSGKLNKDAARRLTDQIRAAAGGGVDVIYDGVGGDYSEPALRTMAWGGRFLVVGFPAGIARVPLNLPLLKGCSIIGVFLGAFIERSPESNRQNTAKLFAMYEAGDLHPLVSARYPLENAGDAIAHLASRSAIGKVVVMIGEDR